jgi:hypothetical protein
MGDIVDEHRTLLAAFRVGDPAAMGQALDDHISVQAHAVDYGGIIERRRAELDQARPLPRRVRARGTGGSGGDKASE